MKKRKKFKLGKVLLFFILLIIVILLAIDTKKQIELQKGEEPIIQTASSRENELKIGQVKEENKIEKEKEIESKITDWNLILVNKENPIPKGYKIETQVIEQGYQVDKRIVEAIEEMLQDARKAGMNPWICSSYRSPQTQKELFQNQVNKYIAQGYSQKIAEEKAATWVAIPRTSEHELGLSLDIVDRGYQLLDENQANRKTQQWLMENCINYGFVLRYEKEKEEITNINHEPWHYRYVGIENAKFMKEKGFCLEEYITYLKGERNG